MAATISIFFCIIFSGVKNRIWPASLPAPESMGRKVVMRRLFLIFLYPTRRCWLKIIVFMSAETAEQEIAVAHDQLEPTGSIVNRSTGRGIPSRRMRGTPREAGAENQDGDHYPG